VNDGGERGGKREKLSVRLSLASPRHSDPRLEPARPSGSSERLVTRHPVLCSSVPPLARVPPPAKHSTLRQLVHFNSHMPVYSLWAAQAATSTRLWRSRIVSCGVEQCVILFHDDFRCSTLLRTPNGSKSSSKGYNRRRRYGCERSGRFRGQPPFSSQRAPTFLRQQEDHTSAVTSSDVTEFGRY
jgi:hypothetical protein